MGEEDPKPMRVDPATGLTINRYRPNGPGSGVVNRRVREVRPATENFTRAPKYTLVLLQQDGDEVDRYDRPRVRGDCEAGGSNEERPCPWVSCRYHLHADVLQSGSLRINKPDEDVADMPPAATCALDVAGAGGVSLEVIGAVLNVSRERARQVEERALRRLLVALRLQGKEGEMRELLAALGEQDHDSPLASAEESE